VKNDSESLDIDPTPTGAPGQLGVVTRLQQLV
jgi:hypothetical protein